MQIALTKKLADASKQTLEPIQEDINPLFSWTANWVKVWENSRVEDMLVIVNNSTRFTVAIYQVKRKDLKKMTAIMSAAIRNTLLAMNLNPAIVEAYMEQSGDMTFVRNSDRKGTSWVNRAALEASIEVFHNYQGVDKIYSDVVGINANYGPVNFGKNVKDGFYPNEKMFAELSALTGHPIYKYRAFELLVTLDLDIHQTQRSLIVPANIKFSTLHKVLQSAFDWENSHLYVFELYKNKPNQRKSSQPDQLLVPSRNMLSFGPKANFIEEQQLSDFLFNYERIIYAYDLGDNWKHEVQLVREIENYDQRSPYLLEASGPTPPEDVGGIDGYLDFYEIMLEPDHPEYEHLSNWAPFWRPELSDMDTRPKILRF